MIDMWDWLSDAFNEGSITISELEEILYDKSRAYDLWMQFADDEKFADLTQNEVKKFYRHIISLKIKEENDEENT